MVSFAMYYNQFMEPKDDQPAAVTTDTIQARLKTFQTPEITHNTVSATIAYKDLHLSAEHPTTTPLEIIVEKHPLILEKGKTYGRYQDVLVDEETPGMLALAKEAEKLRELPEQDRPRAVLSLLRNNVHYAYDDVMELVAKQDPELAAWVAKNTGLERSEGQVALSDIFEKQHGVCVHLSVAYLWLAQKAGLQGSLMSSDGQSIRNIKRTDQPGNLYQSIGLGEFLASHSWNEIQLSDGRWIPVDPSAQLVGDTEETLQMFKDANYQTPIDAGLNFTREPAQKVEIKGAYTDIPMFYPGEATARGKWQLLLSSTRGRARMGDNPGITPPTNEPFDGDATLTISASPNRGVLNLTIKSAILADRYED